MPVKERENGAIRSKFFKRSDGTESRLQQAASTQPKVTSIASKRIGTKQPSPADERREGIDAKDGQSGNKLAVISWSHSRESTRSKPVQAGQSWESFKGLNKTGDGFNADGTQTGSKLIGTSMPTDQDVRKGEVVPRGNGKNIKDPFSSHVYTSRLTVQTTKSVANDCVNPRPSISSMMSIQNVKNICVDGKKNYSLKAGRSTSGLSSLKIVRTAGENLDPLTSTIQKQGKSPRNSEQNVELQQNTASKMANSVETDSQALPTQSLKRKTFEVDVDMVTLNPLKRLSESPSENRSFTETSERVLDIQVCSQQHLADGHTKCVSNECQSSTLDIPQEVNMTELETPSIIEHNSNIEKAEACTKELEDICSMLKRKLEEAKEILVRAIVNNNNLLMLNHPIYEENMRMVQKFAAALMAKEIHT